MDSFASVTQLFLLSRAYLTSVNLKDPKLGLPNILVVLGDLTGAPGDAQWAKPGYSHLNAALGALYALYVVSGVHLLRKLKS